MIQRVQKSCFVALPYLFNSIKQYKTQIGQWQKEGRFPPKHIKRADMEAMVSLKEQRALDGKQTVFFYRGWRIDDIKIKRFIFEDLS